MDTERTNRRITESIANVARRFFVWFGETRRTVVRRFTYSALFIVGYEGTYKNVCEERNDIAADPPPKLESIKHPEPIIETAKKCLDDAESRREAVTDKFKILLTLSTVVFAATGVLFGRQLPNSAVVWILFVFAGAMFTTAIVLLSVTLDIRRSMVTTISEAEANLESDELTVSLTNDYLRCASWVDNQTDYLVSVYQAARFYFLSAFFILAGAYAADFATQRSPAQYDPLIRTLRGDPELVELLRGPKGDRGEKGDQGPQGVQGPRGERGPRGEPGIQTPTR